MVGQSTKPIVKNLARRKLRGLKYALTVAGVFVVLSLMQRPGATQVAPRVPVSPDTPRIEMINGLEAVAGEIIIRFDKSMAPQALEFVSAMADAEEGHQIGSSNLRLYCLHSRSKNLDTLVKELSTLPGVMYAEPNYIVRTTQVTALPNDTRFGDLWGLQNTGQTVNGSTGTAGADISAVPAWDVSKGSASIVVGVVDTGIDYNHPDLAANVWSAPTAFTVTIGGQNITCPQGSHGFNAITNSCDPLDDNNHGTHVSGTIGAVGNNGQGVVGVNWTTSIMGLKFLNSGGSGNTADAIDAIEFAVQAKQIFSGGANVRVLSNSWGGGGFSQALLDEINRANSNDMLFVAAAGNNNSNNDNTAFFPANYNAPNVISVAATDNRDAKASFSNFGATTVHLGAPGVNILSTVRNGGLSFFNGTSMATPHVSGAAALVLSACNQNTASLKATLLNNVDSINSMSGITITGGRLNVDRAIQSCTGPFNVSATPGSRSVAPGGSTTYSVTVGVNGGFSGTVNLSISGLPSGATANFNPPSVTGGGTSTLTVNTSASTPLGTSTLTITGTSGSVQDSTTVSLTVANPDFTIAATPASRTVAPGTSTTYAISIGSIAGFNGAVSLGVTGLPSGATASFNPATVTAPGSSTLNVNTSSSTPEGTFTLTVTGASGSLQHSTTVTLQVIQPDFRLTVSPASKTVRRGFTALYTVNVESLKGFTGTIQFSASGVPSGTTTTFNPTSVNISPSFPRGFCHMILRTSSTTPTGTFTITVRGTGGGLQRTATTTLVVTP